MKMMPAQSGLAQAFLKLELTQYIHVAVSKLVKAKIKSVMASFRRHLYVGLSLAVFLFCCSFSSLFSSAKPAGSRLPFVYQDALFALERKLLDEDPDADLSDLPVPNGAEDEEDEEDSAASNHEEAEAATELPAVRCSCWVFLFVLILLLLQNDSDFQALTPLVRQPSSRNLATAAVSSQLNETEAGQSLLTKAPGSMTKASAPTPQQKVAQLMSEASSSSRAAKKQAAKKLVAKKNKKNNKKAANEKKSVVPVMPPVAKKASKPAKTAASSSSTPDIRKMLASPSSVPDRPFWKATDALASRKRAPKKSAVCVFVFLDLFFGFLRCSFFLFKIAKTENREPSASNP